MVAAILEEPLDKWQMFRKVINLVSQLFICSQLLILIQQIWPAFIQHCSLWSNKLRNSKFLHQFSHSINHYDWKQWQLWKNKNSINRKRNWQGGAALPSYSYSVHPKNNTFMQERLVIGVSCCNLLAKWPICLQQLDIFIIPNIQEMVRLKTDSPWVYKRFTDHGLHIVCRSNRFWAGLWTNLIIEQMMMRFLKSQGGLTCDRGVTEPMRTTWINSMHPCVAIHNLTNTLTNIKHRTSKQHIDLTAGQRQWDMADMEKLNAWFQTHNSFAPDIATVINLSTGLIAGENDNVNCEDAEVVDQMI